MSHWRWIQTSSSRAILWLTLALATIPAIRPTVRADDPSRISSGPASPEEAAILWNDGRADFERGADETAIPKLERFVARYPGYPDYFEARHLLGKAYLRQRHAAKAKKELKAFVLARGRSTEALLARLELARADLALEQPEEALLTAEEALRLASKPERPELQAESLALRARAQIALQQDKRAAQSIASATRKAQTAPSRGHSRVQGEIRAVSLELKLRQCAKFPPRGKLDEGQVRDQLGRRGSCLLESLFLFKDALAAGDSTATREAEELLSQAYSSYWVACQNPPPPLPSKPKDRSTRQLKTYFKELAVVLESDCRQKIRQGSDILGDWKASLPSTGVDAAARVRSSMEKLR